MALDAVAAKGTGAMPNASPALAAAAASAPAASFAAAALDISAASSSVDGTEPMLCVHDFTGSAPSIWVLG
jgi:hypothetical protein